MERVSFNLVTSRTSMYIANTYFRLRQTCVLAYQQTVARFSEAGEAFRDRYHWELATLPARGTTTLVPSRLSGYLFSLDGKAAISLYEGTRSYAVNTSGKVLGKTFRVENDALVYLPESDDKPQVTLTTNDCITIGPDTYLVKLFSPSNRIEAAVASVSTEVTHG